jgi:hypothetical protein
MLANGMLGSIDGRAASTNLRAASSLESVMALLASEELPELPVLIPAPPVGGEADEQAPTASTLAARALTTRNIEKVSLR